MHDPPRFLERAGALRDAEAAHALYTEWAPSYERDVQERRYATPARCAEALLACGANLAAPLLDLGCGTGLSGAAFRAAGFHVVDGSDFCAQMLALARAKAGVYRELALGDLERPIPAHPGDYGCIAAVDVLGPAHGPPEAIDDVLMRLAAGALFVFSLSDRALAEPRYQAQIESACGGGTAQALYDEYGAHLPGAGLRARVVVLRRS